MNSMNDPINTHTEPAVSNDLSAAETAPSIDAAAKTATESPFDLLQDRRYLQRVFASCFG